jgi:hypothetical protein
MTQRLIDGVLECRTTLYIAALVSVKGLVHTISHCIESLPVLLIGRLEVRLTTTTTTTTICDLRVAIDQSCWVLLVIAEAGRHRIPQR